MGVRRDGRLPQPDRPLSARRAPRHRRRGRAAQHAAVALQHAAGGPPDRQAREGHRREVHAHCAGAAGRGACVPAHLEAAPSARAGGGPAREDHVDARAEHAALLRPQRPPGLRLARRHALCLQRVRQDEQDGRQLLLWFRGQAVQPSAERRPARPRPDARGRHAHLQRARARHRRGGGHGLLHPGRPQAGRVVPRAERVRHVGGHQGRVPGHQAGGLLAVGGGRCRRSTRRSR